MKEQTAKRIVELVEEHACCGSYERVLDALGADFPEIKALVDERREERERAWREEMEKPRPPRTAPAVTAAEVTRAAERYLSKKAIAMALEDREAWAKRVEESASKSLGELAQEALVHGDRTKPR